MHSYGCLLLSVFQCLRDSKKVRNCSATALVFAIRVEFLVVTKYSNLGVSSEGSY
jgi:hypothetical protein